MSDQEREEQLVRAVWAGDTASVARLLADGVCPNATGVAGVTVLTVAAENGHEDIVAALLAAGAAVHYQRRWTGGTALTGAMNGNHVGIVRRLLNAGADVNQQDQYGFQPLTFAAQNNQANFIPILLQAGADVNASNSHQDTALTFAAWSGFTEIVEMLVAVDGVEIDHADADGDTALLCGADESHGAIIDILCRAGANVHCANQSGETALLRVSRKGSIEIVEGLLAFGAAVGHTDGNGKTALCYASESGSAAVVERLLGTGEAPIDHMNTRGETALMVAARNGHAQVLEVLLSHGADVNHASENVLGASAEEASIAEMTVVPLLPRTPEVNSHIKLVDMVNTRGSANAAAHGGRAPSEGSTFSQPRNPPPQPPAGAAPPAARDQAIAAQIAAVGPALVAIAAALGQQIEDRPASVQSRPQPEGEPAEDADQGIDDEAGNKKTDKIDTRNIKVTPFDGVVPAGSFDAKARDFREELDEQIDDAQSLAGQVWSDEVKKAILKLFLTGMARRWYRDWRVANPAATYSDAGDALVHEFRPVLLGVDIADRIRRERKRWNETYREFADRLLQMTDALEGGKSLPANERHALVAFVRNAYPKYTDFLETKVDLDGDQPEKTLKTAISVLSRKAETDGRLPDRVKTKPAAQPAAQTNKGKGKAQRPQKAKGTKPEANKKRPAEASAAVVERKKKFKPASAANPRSGIVCFDCGATGHTASYCRRFLQGKRKPDDDSVAAAQSAVEDAEREVDMDQDDASDDDADDQDE